MLGTRLPIFRPFRNTVTCTDKTVAERDGLPKFLKRISCGVDRDRISAT
jgi:hypothetical protein